MARQVLVVGIAIFFAHFLVLVFRRTRVPDVLLLMLSGIVIGPGLGLVSPQDFGVVGPVVTAIALIVLLFESGVSLSIRALLQAFGQTVLVSLSSWLLTAAAVTLLVRWLSPLDWGMAALTGVILGGTSSAVVIPLIDGLAMNERPRTVLFLESALTDVLCIAGAVTITEALAGGGLSAMGFGAAIGRSFGLALLVGAGAGAVWGVLMGKIRQFPNTIFTTVAYVFIVYGVAELLECSGAIAALALGVTLSNLSGLRVAFRGKVLEIQPLRDTDRLFFAESVFLLKTFFFLYLGLSLRADEPAYAAVAAVIVAAIYPGRFIIVRLFASRRFSPRDASLMTTMVPKGLAAAVLSGLPAQRGLPSAEWVQGIVYMVVLFSISFTALLVLLIERTGLRRAYERAFSSFDTTQGGEGATARPGLAVSRLASEHGPASARPPEGSSLPDDGRESPGGVTGATGSTSDLPEARASDTGSIILQDPRASSRRLAVAVLAGPQPASAPSTKAGVAPGGDDGSAKP